MAKFESSIRRARSALVVLAASACLQWAATPAQAQEDFCRGVFPEGGIHATTDDFCERRILICNIQGCPEVPPRFDHPEDPNPLCPGIPSLISSIPEDTYTLYLEQLNQEWGPIPLGNGPFCSKAVQNFVKVCRTVVKSNVECVEHQIDNLAKQDEDGCKAFAGSEAKACAESVDSAVESYLASLASAQTAAETNCTISTGNHFFRKCMFNVP